MTKRTAVKNLNGSGWLIDDGSGFSIRYATKGDAERQIARMEKIEAEEIAYKAEQRVTRLGIIKDYLAVRAARKAEADKQGAFSF